MNDYNVVGLYEHNVVSYKKIKEGFQNGNIVSIVHATGTGKSYNALQLAYDNKDKKIVYIAPSNSIIEHLKEIIEKNPNLDLESDFSNLEFKTYQSLINLSENELVELNVDLLILDEFHHIGAPVWGERVSKIVESHKNMKILGMTAYTVRDRGTSYERDMVNFEKNELFSKSVVSNYDLCDAMIDGVLSKPVYKSGYVYLEQTADAIEQRLEKLNHESNDYKELYPILKEIKKELHECLSVKDILKVNIKKNGKYIYFCPLGIEDGQNDINTIMEEARGWISEMGLSDDEYEFYVSTSKMGEVGKKNREAFYNDEDLEGDKVNNKLRIMFAINQYNEGVHAPGLDGVIMGRGTQSDIVFFEQLGRALSVRVNTKEEYDELYAKSIEELIELCNNRKIKINDINSKEEIIEQLIAPVIIDLANNIGFIKELENNLKDRVKEIQLNTSSKKRKIHLVNTSFDIDMINENLFETLEYLYDRLTKTWMDYYDLAKNYYEHYGNLEIPQDFKTVNGYTEDENGISLGRWINSQRRNYNDNKLNEERINLLKSIDMNFNLHNDRWNKYYSLAKKYYEHYGNLKIPRGFKTINGYDKDESGMPLGKWLNNQRWSYKGSGSYKITDERIKKLEEIGMIFDTKNFEEEWNKKYKLAKVYYEHYGNLKIPQDFITINGYEYDENGETLGTWINTQKIAHNKNELNEERIKLLEEIGIVFNLNEEKWNKNYELAKSYYEHYGNLKINQHFKTINGYEYVENGIALGKWIDNQRNAYKAMGNYKLNEEQIKKLESIGMKWFLTTKKDDKFQKEEITKDNYKIKQIELLNRFRSYLNKYDNESLPTKEEINQGFLEELNHVFKGK